MFIDACHNSGELAGAQNSRSEVVIAKKNVFDKNILLHPCPLLALSFKKKNLGLGNPTPHKEKKVIF